ncbi:MAG: hypothetical protein AB8I08_10235 [Sandaracinaceae bacterium]
MRNATVQCWLILVVTLAGVGCAAGHVTQPPTTPRPSGRTALRLPPPGQVVADLLVSGDPVFVVRTESDEVRVLAADVRSVAPVALRTVRLGYDASCDCFWGAAPFLWNLEGQIMASTQADTSHVCTGCAIGVFRSFDGALGYAMDRYDIERQGERVVVGERRGTHRPTQRVERVVVDSHLQNRECPELPPRFSLSEALEQPEGQVVAFPARVTAHDDRSVRVCDPAPEDRIFFAASVTSTLRPSISGLCPDDAPRVSGEIPAFSGAQAVGLLTARRHGEGFAELALVDCEPDWVSWCRAPRHDPSWMRTAAGNFDDVTIDPPVACEERPHPHTRMVAVHGRGRRSLVGSEHSEGCLAASPDDPCDRVAQPAFHQAVMNAVRSRPTMSFGIGDCFDAVRTTEGRLAVGVHDWAHVDEALEVVRALLTEWDVSTSLWVSVEPMFCGQIG